MHLRLPNYASSLFGCHAEHAAARKGMVDLGRWSCVLLVFLLCGWAAPTEVWGPSGLGIYPV
jgi:hypothetical protein